VKTRLIDFVVKTTTDSPECFEEAEEEETETDEEAEVTRTH
jgi:hypothetical protein